MKLTTGPRICQTVSTLSLRTRMCSVLGRPCSVHTCPSICRLVDGERWTPEVELSDSSFAILRRALASALLCAVILVSTIRTVCRRCGVFLPTTTTTTPVASGPKVAAASPPTAVGQEASKTTGAPAAAKSSVAMLVRFIDQVNTEDQGENDIPLKFVQGCFFDMAEARRRWDITRAWREMNGINNILEEPQPYFDLIKEAYPHYWVCRARSGSVVYLEETGKIDTKRLLNAGISVKELVRYYIFLTGESDHDARAIAKAPSPASRHLSSRRCMNCDCGQQN